ncbi:phosphoglucan, water dikinase, chloroplastic, partial [Haematococcus lacustris]
MSRSPVRQHTRSPSLARTAQSSHPGFVVSSSADDADTQPGGEDPQMAIISWSITPPPETHAAMAQGPGQPATEQERVVLVQLALPYKVDFGEVIKVSGNTPEFGSWDIEHAVQMHWTPGNVWVAELRLAPGTYEIKALVRHSTMRDLVRWEEGPNHQLQVPAEPGVLQASWPWSEGPFQQSTGLRGARTVAPTSLSRSLLLTPARLLLVQDAVAYKQQQGVLLGPPALGQGGGLGASVGRAVSPGRAGRSGLWLPERWEGRLGARHAAGKGQSSSSSLVPVGLGKLLDPRRHLPNSQGRFKAMEGKQGDSAQLPHQLLLLPNTHSPKVWVHHNSRQSRAITQLATPHQKVMLALSGPGQPALIGCGMSTSTPP